MLFRSYATVNMVELVHLLGAEKAAQAVRVFGEAFIRSTPLYSLLIPPNNTLSIFALYSVHSRRYVSNCSHPFSVML